MLPNEILDQVQQLRATATALESLAREQADLDRRVAAATALYRTSSAPPPLTVQPLMPGFNDDAPDLPEIAPPSAMGGSPAGRNVTGSKGGSYNAFVPLALDALGTGMLSGEEIQTLIAGKPGVPTNLNAVHSMLRRMRLNGLLVQPVFARWQAAAFAPTPN